MWSRRFLAVLTSFHPPDAAYKVYLASGHHCHMSVNTVGGQSQPHITLAPWQLAAKITCEVGWKSTLNFSHVENMYIKNNSEMLKQTSFINVKNILDSRSSVFR